MENRKKGGKMRRRWKRRREKRKKKIGGDIEGQNTSENATKGKKGERASNK